MGVEQDVEQRGVLQGAFGLDLGNHPFKGQVLVCQRVQHLPADFAQDFSKRRPTREVGTQGQRLDEGPDTRFQLAPDPTGARKTDDQVRLPRLSVQKHQEGCEPGHKRRGILLAGKALDRRREFGFQADRTAAGLPT